MKHCPPDTDIWDCPPAPHGEAVGTASADLSCDLITAQIWGRSREAPPPGTAVGLPGAWRWPALPPVGRWGKATEPGGRQTCTGRCPRRWGSRPGGSIHVFHRQQSGGFPRSCPPGAEARLRRLAARTDGARGQRKQQGVYGARGWQVHSVRGQLRTVRAPGVEGTQRQRAAWAVRALRVRSVSPLLWRGFQVPPRHGPGATGTVLGHRALPLVAPPLGGRWVKPEVLVHACTAALNLKTS